MVALLAMMAAVAGGTLGITTTPGHPRVGNRVAVHTTGYAGEHGHLYIYRNPRRRCGSTQRSERRRGTLLLQRTVADVFEFKATFRPRRARREWICGYLYSHACDAAGQNCGPALGLPPDAGFSRVPITVRRRR